MSMPTYLYETIPAPDAAAERFEWRQSMNEPALEKHPDTGVPVRRVISGGLGLMSAPERAMPDPGPGCGPGSCGCGRF
ncbi:MAG: FmdB family zinc ribbon protein [Gemmatimonadaceae bacterium]